MDEIMTHFNVARWVDENIYHIRAGKWVDENWENWRGDHDLEPSKPVKLTFYASNLASWYACDISIEAGVTKGQVVTLKHYSIKADVIDEIAMAMRSVRSAVITKAKEDGVDAWFQSL